MPTPTLNDGQYDLDGYTFGSLADEVVLLESGIEWGQVGVRTQDVPEPLGDGVLFGRDYLEPPTWTFTLGARHVTDVAPVVGRLASAWRGDAARRTPGARSVLHYRRGGTTRVVYGRPRRFAVETPKVWDPDFRVITCDFQLADPVVYDSTESTLLLSLVRSSTATGLVFPVVFPVTFGSVTGSRAGIVTVAGSVPVPFRVTFAGPATGSATALKVTSTGWTLDVPVTLAAGQTLVVDTATGVVTLNGAPAQIGLGRGTNLSARLQPGPQEVVFTATDTSQTSTATVAWRAASAAAI